MDSYMGDFVPTREELQRALDTPEGRRMMASRDDLVQSNSTGSPINRPTAARGTVHHKSPFNMPKSQGSSKGPMVVVLIIVIASAGGWYLSHRSNSAAPIKVAPVKVDTPAKQ